MPRCRLTYMMYGISETVLRYWRVPSRDVVLFFSEVYSEGITREEMMMKGEKEERLFKWKLAMMYCPNCGHLVMGYRNEDGIAKMECPVCKLCMVSKQKSRRHETLDIYAPVGQVALN